MSLTTLLCHPQWCPASHAKWEAGHVIGEVPKEGELVVIKDSSTEGWFLSEVLRVPPNLVEVRYFTTPIPALENYEHCSVQKRSERLSEICFRRTWHVRFGKHVGRAIYKPPYPNNEDLQVWKGVINNSDLDSLLLLRNVTTGSKLSTSRPLKSLAGMTREMSRLNVFPSYCSSS